MQSKQPIGGRGVCGRTFLTGILLLYILSGVSTASAESESVRDQRFDKWPDLMLGAGVLYAPAPLIMERNEDRTDKLLDELGWQAVLEWRILEYMTIGGQLIGMYNTRRGERTGSFLLEPGFRLGALIPLGERWAIRAVVVGGFSGLGSDRPDRVSSYDRGYYGLQVWAIAGLTYRLNRDLMFYADLSGTAARYSATSGMSVEGLPIESYDLPSIFRLQFGMGITVCWDRVLWRPPPEARY